MKKAIIATTLIGIFLSFFSSCNPKREEEVPNYEQILLEVGKWKLFKVDHYDPSKEEEVKGSCELESNINFHLYKDESGNLKFKANRGDKTSEGDFKILQDKKKIIFIGSKDDEYDIIEVTKDSFINSHIEETHGHKTTFYYIPLSSEKKC